MSMRAHTGIGGRPGRARGRGWPAALVVMVAAAVPALAEPWRIAAVTPDLPTWREPVRVTITGTVPGGCGPDVGEPVRTALAPARFRIALPLSLDCVLPTGSEQAFVDGVDLGPLDIGTYEVRLGTHGDPLDVVSFVVYEVSTTLVEVPALSTDASPGALSITMIANGKPTADLRVVGRVLEVSLTAPAGPILPLLFTVDVPLPALVAGTYDVRVFSTDSGPVPSLVRSSLRVWDADRCLPDALTLCLHDGRFRVTGSWRDFAARTGAAHANPLANGEASGLLWFFAADNAEITLKVLDGCGLNQHWWVFLASGSTVAYEVEVTDMATGARKSYPNTLGSAAPLVPDVAAFPCI